MSVYFISAAKCKELASVNLNTDDQLIIRMIDENQRLYIEAVLGTALYNELITQVQNSTVTVLNATLLEEYIIPCLALYVKSDCAINLNFKLTNKAVTSKNSENSNPVFSKDCERSAQLFEYR